MDRHVVPDLDVAVARSFCASFSFVRFTRRLPRRRRNGIAGGISPAAVFTVGLRVETSFRLEPTRLVQSDREKRSRERRTVVFSHFFLFSILFFCIEQACRGTGFDIGA